MKDTNNQNVFPGIDEETKEPITMYQNTIGRVDPSAAPLSLYTTSREEWSEYTEELKSMAVYVALRHLMYGVLIGLLFSFFTISKADPAIISEIKKHSPKEYHSTLLAIADIESSFNPSAIGEAKEFGLFQFHPGAFKLPLKDPSVKGQTKEAVKHLKWLKRYCPTDLAIAWNLGCDGAKKIQQPKKFGYYIKFALAKERYEKKSQNSGTASSNKREASNSTNANKEI